MSDIKTSAIEQKNKQKSNLDEFNHEFALAILIGSWDKNNLRDKKIISQIVNRDYKEWISVLDENKILKSHFIFKNEQSRTVLKERKKLWNSLSVNLSDTYLENFKKAAISVLRESSHFMLQEFCDMDLDHTHKIKSLSCSTKLKEGLAGGLALLGNSQSSHTSSKKNISSLAVYRIFKDADEKIWKALAPLLPILAEAAPKEFLNAVERVLKQPSSSYKKIFFQQNEAVADYLLWALEVLAWDEQYLKQVCLILGQMIDDQDCIQLGHLIDDALESLLWEESLPPIQIKTAPNKLSFEVSKLKLMDFKKNHQPINVLRNILCPWNLQTKASYETCQAVFTNLRNEKPEVAWHLLISLFPSWRNNYTEDTYQPIFQSVLIHSKKEFLQDDYLQQTQAYFDLAISIAGYDIQKLTHLTRTLYYFYPKSLIIERSPLSQIDKNRQDIEKPVDNLLVKEIIPSVSQVHKTPIEVCNQKNMAQVNTTSKQDVINEFVFTNPFPLLTKFLDHLSLREISEKPEDQRLELWICLNKLVLLHRCSSRQWVFDDMTILKIENIIKKLAPKNPLLFNQRWFSDMATTHLMYQIWFPNNKRYNKEGEKKLNQIRKEAIKEIIYEGEVRAIIQFAQAVNHPEVGACLASAVCNPEFDKILLPRIFDNLVTEDQSVTKCLTSFLIGYIKQRQKDHNLSHSSSLSWLDQLDRSKWTSTQVGQFSHIMQQISTDLQSSKLWDEVANGTANPNEVKKEIERMIISHQIFHNLSYITELLEKNQNLKTSYFSTDCIKKLLRAGLLSKELSHDQEAIDHLLYFVQVLYKNSQKANKHQSNIDLNDLFTEDAQLFCRVIHLPYLTYANNYSQSGIEQICQLLLHKWTTPPKNLRDWIESVKSFCIEQKHLKNALEYVGEMLATISVKKGMFVASGISSEWVEVLNTEKEIRRGFINTLSKKTEAIQKDAFGQFINDIQRISQKWKESGYSVLSYDLDQFVTELHFSSQVVEKLANQIHHFVFEKASSTEKQVSAEDFRSFCEEIKSEINHLIQKKVKNTL